MMNLHNPSTGKGWEWDRLVGKSSSRINLRALLKNLGPADSGGHSTIFMEEGVRNTLI